jgi:hypothetical protein
VTGPPASAATRSAGSRPSIRSVTTARPVSTASHCAPVIRAGQARSRRRRQSGHRRELLPGRVRALAVQPGQEILPSQLGRRDPRQQLPSPEPTDTHLDRPDRGVECLDHAQPVTHLGHPRPSPRSRSATGPPRRRPPDGASASRHVSFSPDRCLPAREILTSQTTIIPGQNGTYRYSKRCVADLIADSGLRAAVAITPVCSGARRDAETRLFFVECSTDRFNHLVMDWLIRSRGGDQIGVRNASGRISKKIMFAAELERCPWLID